MKASIHIHSTMDKGGERASVFMASMQAEQHLISPTTATTTQHLENLITLFFGSYGGNMTTGPAMMLMTTQQNMTPTTRSPAVSLAAATPASSSAAASEASSSSILNGPRGNFVVTDILSSCLALIGNALILAALIKTRLAVCGYRRFLLSLSAADIFMALTVMLTFIHQSFSHGVLSQAAEDWGNILLRNLTLVSYFASLLSIAGLTVDNFIGVFRQLRYRQLMGSERLKWLIIGIWTSSFFLGFSDTLEAIGSYLYLKIARERYSVTPNFTTLMPTINESAGEDYLEYQDEGPEFPTSSSYHHETRPILRTTAHVLNPTALPDDSGNKEDKLHVLISDVLQLVESQQKDKFGRIFNIGVQRFGVEFFVIGLTIPCFILILVIYGCIVFKVLRRKRIGETATANSRLVDYSRYGPRFTFPSLSLNNGPPQKHRSPFPVRLVLTTSMLISSFTFCWMPFVTFELFMIVRQRLVEQDSGAGKSAAASTSTSFTALSSTLRVIDKNETLLMINSIFNSLLMLSPLLNPIIYSVRLPRVRHTLFRILRCQLRSRRNYSNEFGVHQLVVAISSTDQSSQPQSLRLISSGKSLLYNPRSSSTVPDLDNI